MFSSRYLVFLDQDFINYFFPCNIGAEAEHNRTTNPYDVSSRRASSVIAGAAASWWFPTQVY